MRDFQADWKHWSSVERIIATLLGVASIVLGTIYYLQA